METELDLLFENFKNRIDFSKSWDVAVFIIKFHTKETGAGSCSIQFAENGEYNFISMKGLPFESINRIQSSSSDKWNKAVLTIYKDETYYFKTWWDAEFQKSLYGIED